MLTSLFKKMPMEIVNALYYYEKRPDCCLILCKVSGLTALTVADEETAKATVRNMNLKFATKALRFDPMKLIRKIKEGARVAFFGDGEDRLYVGSIQKVHVESSRVEVVDTDGSGWMVDFESIEKVFDEPKEDDETVKVLKAKGFKEVKDKPEDKINMPIPKEFKEDH